MRLAGQVRKLSEENLARWSQMDVAEQLDLYQVMLELEIDAQRRILTKYGEDPDIVAEIQERLLTLDLRLQQVDEALQDPSVRPDWLDPDRPPRLFNQPKPQAVVGATWNFNPRVDLDWRGL